MVESDDRGLPPAASTPARRTGAATCAPKLASAGPGRSTGREPADAVLRRVRAFAPEPGASTTFRGETSRSFAPRRPRSDADGASPGTEESASDRRRGRRWWPRAGARSGRSRSRLPGAATDVRRRLGARRPRLSRRAARDRDRRRAARRSRSRRSAASPRRAGTPPGVLPALLERSRPRRPRPGVRDRARLRDAPPSPFARLGDRAPCVDRPWHG